MRCLRLLLAVLLVPGAVTAERSPPTPVRIEVLPAVAELEPGQRQRFAARAVDAQGQDVRVALRWGSDAGQITAGGVFSAATAGRYTITAATADGRVVGTAAAVIHAAPKVLGRLVLRPSEAVVAPGGAVQFRIVLLDRAGRELPTDAQWTARGGRIDAHGLYVAGPHPGRFLVSVFERASGNRASAAVLVQGQAP